MKDNSIMVKFVEDLEAFVKSMQNGMGYVLKSDLLRQFHEYTNHRWNYFIFKQDNIMEYLIDECERMNVKVYEDEEEMMKEHKEDF